MAVDRSRYRGRLEIVGALRFWVGFLWESYTTRSLRRLVHLRLGDGIRVETTGTERLPSSGSFVLAVNHFGGRPALEGIAAVVSGAANSRPDLFTGLLVLSGRRSRSVSGAGRLVAVPGRLVADRVLSRWHGHLIRIPLGNERPSVKMLRKLRERAAHQPLLVFPEGIARVEFENVRPGSGRWLASFEIPVLPVGVWCDEGAWRVRIGPPIRWAERSELRDLQLGLNIASLLPSELAPIWQEDLREWRSIHQP